MHLLSQLKPAANPSKGLITHVNPIEATNVVQELIGTYKLNFDLVNGDRIVKAALQHRLRDIGPLTDQITQCQTRLGTDINRVERLSIERQIKELMANIEQLKSQPQVYTQRAQPLLQAFAGCAKPRVVAIGQEVVPNEADYERLDLIEKWLSLAGEYITVRMMRELAPTDSCPDCDEPYARQGSDVYCPSCFRLATTSQIPLKYRELHTTQSNSRKKNYNVTENLRKTFNRIQGNSESRLPYSEIETAFNKHLSLYTWDKDKLTRDNVEDMMKLYGFTDYYLDLNLIMHRYLGKPLPNWSIYEERVMQRYSRFLPVYDVILKQRTSAINGQYMIYKLLRMEGCDVDPSWFKMTRGEDSIEEYERILKEACERLDTPGEAWVFEALNPN